MNTYITEFPKGEDWRYLKDRENLIDQYADSMKIFLDKDIEDLIYEGKPEEAYEKLCSKFPERLVKRIQNNEDDCNDLLLLNSVECTCIRSLGNIFKASDGVMPDYFIIKANTIEDSSMMRALHEDELGRLYYLAHPEENELATQLLKSYGIL